MNLEKLVNLTRQHISGVNGNLFMSTNISGDARRDRWSPTLNLRNRKWISVTIYRSRNLTRLTNTVSQRNLYAPNIKVKNTKKLKLPPASKKELWKGIDEDLVMICGDIVGGSPEEKLHKTEEKIHTYLESRFGEEVKLYKKRPTNEDRETRTIRGAKRDARKEVKKAKKSKNKDSIADAKKEYLRLVRLHNKSRRNEIRKKKKEDRKEQERFRKNPYEYSKKLLDEQVKGNPTFTKEDADRFFKNEYSDKERGVLYQKLEGLPEAPEPEFSFTMDKLCRADFDKKLKNRRNKSSPGPNGVPYVVYKRCPHITHTVYLLNNLWQEKTVPLQ